METSTAPNQATLPSDPGLLSTLIESEAAAKAQELITILSPIPPKTEEGEAALFSPSQNPTEGEIEAANSISEGFPYVPTPAIPIPTTAPPIVHSSVPLELLEVNIPPPPQRRTRDFPQLEPILEHGEVSGESPGEGCQVKEETEPTGAITSGL